MDSCSPPLSEKSKEFPHPPSFSEKNGKYQQKICIFPLSCIRKARYGDHAKSDICFPVGSNSHYIVYGIRLLRAKA